MKTRRRGHSGFSIPLYTLCPLWFRFPVQLHPWTIPRLRGHIRIKVSFFKLQERSFERLSTILLVEVTMSPSTCPPSLLQGMPFSADWSSWTRGVRLSLPNIRSTVVGLHQAILP
jgi:hypothetical protein